MAPALIPLIAALTPPLLELFHGWAQRNPNASNEEAAAEIQRLQQSDVGATAEHDALKNEIAEAKSRQA